MSGCHGMMTTATVLSGFRQFLIINLMLSWQRRTLCLIMFFRSAIRCHSKHTKKPWLFDFNTLRTTVCKRRRPDFSGPKLCGVLTNWGAQFKSLHLWWYVGEPMGTIRYNQASEQHMLRPFQGRPCIFKKLHAFCWTGNVFCAAT